MLLSATFKFKTKTNNKQIRLDLNHQILSATGRRFLPKTFKIYPHPQHPTVPTPSRLWHVWKYHINLLQMIQTISVSLLFFSLFSLHLFPFFLLSSLSELQSKSLLVSNLCVLLTKEKKIHEIQATYFRHSCLFLSSKSRSNVCYWGSQLP